jgi:DNA-binding NarL/FixJ family response regulator
VGEATNSREAVDRLAALEPTDELPDVVLMDLLMPAMDGIEATREVKRRFPGVEVVAVTSFLEESKVRAALEAGAAGYLLKDAEAEEVAAAVRAAVRGEVHLDPAVAKQLTASLRAPQIGAVTLRPRASARFSPSSPRAAPTARSRRLSSSRSAPRAPTSATSSRSWDSPRAPRRRCGRYARGSCPDPTDPGYVIAPRWPAQCLGCNVVLCLISPVANAPRLVVSNRLAMTRRLC